MKNPSGQYYHDLITDKSFVFLTELAKRFRFTLIGGWAVFVYTHSLKSKDIDLILGYDELGRIREHYQVVKNDRLKKYEIKTGEFDVDIYLPHYSELGLPAENISAAAAVRSGFRVPPLEILFLLKLKAGSERQGSGKGEKDRLDIFSLALLPEFDWAAYQQAVRRFGLAALDSWWRALLARTIAVPEIGINVSALARQKKRINPRLKDKM